MPCPDFPDVECWPGAVDPTRCRMCRGPIQQKPSEAVCQKHMACTATTHKNGCPHHFWIESKAGA